ncbi:MAG: hypothetical protein AAB490_03995 [Patescibacteria group bacterium]
MFLSSFPKERYPAPLLVIAPEAIVRNCAETEAADIEGYRHDPARNNASLF